VEADVPVENSPSSEETASESLTVPELEAANDNSELSPTGTEQ
jgi:hypothetical protein